MRAICCWLTSRTKSTTWHRELWKSHGWSGTVALGGMPMSKWLQLGDADQLVARAISRVQRCIASAPSRLPRVAGCRDHIPPRAHRSAASPSHLTRLREAPRRRASRAAAPSGDGLKNLERLAEVGCNALTDCPFIHPACGIRTCEAVSGRRWLLRPAATALYASSPCPDPSHRHGPVGRARGHRPEWRH